MDSHPAGSWNSFAWSNPSPIQPPSRRYSIRSDRERDAPEYARALSSDVAPYAASIISSSDSNSHYRSSRGSRGSVASSLLCPLLDFHDSTRRQSDAGAILPMRPLPVIHPTPDPLPGSNPFHSDSTYWTPQSFSLTKQTYDSPPLLSTPISASTLTSGSNLFIPLRRRFLPNIERTSSAAKPRVETQLFGELLLALEEYVAAFGRRVKVSAPHQFSMGGSAAAVVVAAAAGSPNAQSLSDLRVSNPVRTSDRDNTLIQNQGSTDQDSALIQFDSLQLDPWAQSSSSHTRSPQNLSQTTHPERRNSGSQFQVDRSLLSELCEELEYVTSEVIDVVPAFGEKLMQGHYGPLAVRGRVVSANKLPSSSSSTGIMNQTERLSSALERFVDYEPGGSQDTSDGGSGWWAERLLRDLLEGILAETVIKSGSTTILLSSHSKLSGSESVDMSRNTSYQSFSNEISSGSHRKGNSSSLGGRSKNWLRIPQPASLIRSNSFTNNGKSLPNRNLGFLLIDEDEEPPIPEWKRKTDRTTKSSFNTRSNGDIFIVDGIDQSNSTKELLAEASQDSIFEYPALSSSLKEHDNRSKRPQVGTSDPTSGHAKTGNMDPNSDPRPEHKWCEPEGSSSSGTIENKEKMTELNDEHHQKLMDEGRKRWLAFKANQLGPPHSHPDHRHTLNNPFSFRNPGHTHREGFSHQFRDPNPGRSQANSNNSVRNPSNHFYLYNYLAHHHRS